MSQEELKEKFQEWVQEVLPTVKAENQSIPPKQEDELMTRKEAAAYLKVSLVTLNEWTKNGRVKAHRIGTRVRYYKSDVEAALKEIRQYGRGRQPD